MFLITFQIEWEITLYIIILGVSEKKSIEISIAILIYNDSESIHNVKLSKC